MLWRVEVRHKKGVFDALGEAIRKGIFDLGIRSVTRVEAVQVYNLQGVPAVAQIKQIASKLLTNRITQEFLFANENDVRPERSAENKTVIEIAYHPGVMDPVEESTIKGIKDLGIEEIQSVSTAQKYILHGKISKKDLNTIIEKTLSNKLIQHVVKHLTVSRLSSERAESNKFDIKVIDLIKADDKRLTKLSKEGQLFLNLNEMKTIQKHFKKMRRNPTDCELETIAQTWSEHCYHKTFRGNIRYQWVENGQTKTKVIHNLLKSTIVKATEEINKSWCVSVFHDNAGVIEFDDESHVCFKAETHNHPSALEPFGGSNTGIGGVLRDILGTGLGAKPICNTDVFCFAPPDTPFEDLPPGTLHPKRVMKGVVSGVRDYGNKMGIPTVNGSILFDKNFIGNPLVYCGSVGIMPKDKVDKTTHAGDLVVVVGGRTGRDGIHGATFSSGELTSKSEVVSLGAVQIGDPIQEKKVLDALMQARDHGLYCGLTDCGAGGLSSAVGEMGEELGVVVNLENVPLKYEGLTYEEIWISESQERMVLAVRPKHIEQLLSVFAHENVEATVIGEFTGRKRLELYYNDCQVCDLDMAFLYDGIPDVTKEALWHAPQTKLSAIPNYENLNDKLCEVFSHYNVCSKEWVVRQYDHEVQGGSIIKPFVGINNDGPSDAAVIVPKLGSSKGIAVSNGINVRYGMLDPFWMAASCIDEAIRQIIAVGGDLDQIAILDNFCWGNPDKPDRLGGLVRAAEGCYEASVGYGVPFISGKDSLYNEYTEGNKSIAIPGTLLISAIGIVGDVTKTVTMDFKESGNLVYCVGLTKDELGGSIYLDTFNDLGTSVPKVDMKSAVKAFHALSKAVEANLIRSMHDYSEGGLGVALAEMAFSGGLGVEVDLNEVLFEGQWKNDAAILFSESNSRFCVEIDPACRVQFEHQLKGIPCVMIGAVQSHTKCMIKGLLGQYCVNINISQLKEAWQKPLRWG